MRFEVEQKHPVADRQELVRLLDARGVAWQPAQLQIDTYYNHPARDFAKTDEALRIRRVGNLRQVTYKGPKLAAAGKTRQEIEVPLGTPQDTTPGFADMLEVLGFRKVAEVRKSRQPFVVEYDGHTIDGALDEVDRLGSFVELELIAAENQVSAAQATISALAQQLHLGPDERRSYLEMLLG